MHCSHGPSPHGPWQPALGVPLTMCQVRKANLKGLTTHQQAPHVSTAVTSGISTIAPIGQPSAPDHPGPVQYERNAGTWTSYPYDISQKRTSDPTGTKFASFQGQGRVNHVAAKEAQELLGVQMGMFSVNSSSVCVLFYSRASHSFIASKYVDTWQLPTFVLKKPLELSSPRALKATLVSPGLEILLDGIIFPEDLMVLRS